MHSDDHVVDLASIVAGSISLKILHDIGAAGLAVGGQLVDDLEREASKTLLVALGSFPETGPQEIFEALCVCMSLCQLAQEFLQRSRL